MDRYVAALVAERDGYARRGLISKVAEVDAVLRSLGVIDDTEVAVMAPVVERAVRKQAKRRAV